MKASAFLNHLVVSLPFLEELSKMSGNQIDDWLVKLGYLVKDNEELMEKLAVWLAWLPLLESTMGKDNSEPPVPAEVLQWEIELLGLRGLLNEENRYDATGTTSVGVQAKSGVCRQVSSQDRETREVGEDLPKTDSHI